MCKDVVIEMDLMQSLIENDLQEDVGLQSELQHALDVLVDEMLNTLSIYCKVHFNLCRGRVSTIFKSTIVSQLNGNRTLSRD